MIPPVISIVGIRNTGKTILIEKLVSEFKRRGYEVGCIKHHSHSHFDFDVKGKDSWRHKQAGACQSIVSSPGKIGLVRDVKEEMDLTQLRDTYCLGLNLVLAEGYKREDFPRVEVFRKGVSDSILCKNDKNLIALITDAEVEIAVPKFGIEEIDNIANFIERKFLS